MLSTDEQVIDFYYTLFDRIFTLPFRPKIKERLRQDAVARQVQEAAGAASQALTRFFLSEQLSKPQVAEILRGFESLYDLIKLDHIANPNRTPEALVDEILASHPCPNAVGEAGSGAVYRVALHLTVQVLMLVGPVMAEWQRLSFSSTYEMPRRIVSQLNQITESLKAFAGAGQEAADDRYELIYRDHLLQRFYRVEAGTVRMTTNLYVDLRELFVMPRLTVRPKRKDGEDAGALDAESLMNLSAARAVFGKDEGPKAAPDADKKDQGVVAIEQVRLSPRNVVVGVPGSGKSTFLEWLQLSVANVDKELVIGGGQAIPLLLRVRQLDPKNLPHGADLIEKATASRDRATLMPPGWIHRQMKAGRVLFMLDGLDETEPGIRDKNILPWLAELCKEYPDCLYLISSRPVGYPPSALHKLKFAECDLQDFGETEIADYTRHWCTAIRLAQNDPDEEARREGAKEGAQIVAGFEGHAYIRNLARNPLMLSAVCLVNYFEGGQLPKDRAVLYKLCVEGLLHHWDQRRGIHSAYSLDEKLRVSREVAIAMQADDRAEYEAAKVLKIFTDVLKDKDRAKKLLEHIRYRTGLLIERRAGVFAFAHLTFQEYLAARAVYEGNLLGIDAKQLVQEHADSRWNEVIALYCGVAPVKDARKVIENLVKQQDTDQLAEVLAEAFLSTSLVLSQDTKLRKKVLERIAVAPSNAGFVKGCQLNRFPEEEVAPIANSFVGRISSHFFGESYRWLNVNPKNINELQFMKKLRRWRKLSSIQMGDLVYLIHSHSTDELLINMATEFDMYKAPGPSFGRDADYESQAEMALLGLVDRLDRREEERFIEPGAEKTLLQVFRIISKQDRIDSIAFLNVGRVLSKYSGFHYTENSAAGLEFVTLSRQLANRIKQQLAVYKRKGQSHILIRDMEQNMAALSEWANRLESMMKGATGQKAVSDSKERSSPSKRRASAKRAAKKKPTGRRKKA